MAGFNVESEHGLVCKQDEDCLGILVNFDQFNNLPFDLGKAVIGKDIG
ncbi:MAG TPA: hypothetical protein VFF39_10760 [Verrucomicrobiae bacterium]|nr:hypothetical protein [Verrucomicrobiae bacterium]